jgi:hypothetical protein
MCEEVLACKCVKDVLVSEGVLVCKRVKDV